VPIYLCLKLLGPAMINQPMESCLSARPNFADKEGLATGVAEGYLIYVLHTAPVPADVLVDADHIKVDYEWIIEALLVRASLGEVAERGGKEASGVLRAPVDGKVVEECSPLRTLSRLVRERPEYGGSAILVASD